jgi:DNA polymerase III sliding clamp (beta) subunit (PCNA family)
MSENVVLELQDPLSPALLREEGEVEYKCVVMPMRI